MKAPHPIPYQGSKRALAPLILRFFPRDSVRLIEPFAGSAAVSIAALLRGLVSRVILNDINEPLMRLWECIIEKPEVISRQYELLWKEQLGNERAYYDAVRGLFNRQHKPHHLLYLLARCVKASVRYNSEGEFNQSPDNRRKGMSPGTMRLNILSASRLMRGKTTVSVGDYSDVLQKASPADIIYMDPPYQGVCKNRDPRYAGLLAFDAFVTALHDLNRRGLSFIISYDGRTGPKSHGNLLPKALELMHIEVDVGRSSQATLLGRSHRTYESVYLSAALRRRLGSGLTNRLTLTPEQFSLPIQDGKGHITGLP